MIYFRADANENIGLGHTMRCLALADGFRALGHECTFIIASDSKSDGIIEKRGYSVQRLNNGYLKMAEETEELSKILSDSEVIYIVDSYFVPDGYYEKVKEIIGSRGATVCFDDEIIKAFPTDGLINYNLYANEESYEELYKASGLKLPKLYLGGAYIPIRTDVEELPGELVISRKDENEKHVLLSCGGADPEGVAVKFLRFLKENPTGVGKFVFHIPIGAVNAAAEEIRSLAGDLPRVRLYGHIAQFRAFMRQMDYAIAAAGSTLYELCMEGIPTVTYILADNQREIALKFHMMDLMTYAGDCREYSGFVWDLLESLEDLDGRTDLEELKVKMKNTVDGQGAKRLAEVLLKDIRG